MDFAVWKTKGGKLPESFRPLFWSYDFSRIDLEKDKKIIIVQTINYGGLQHWKWILHNYGAGAVRGTLENTLETELRPQARKLARLIFSVKNMQHAPRGSYK